MAVFTCAPAHLCSPSRHVPVSSCTCSFPQPTAPLCPRPRCDGPRPVLPTGSPPSLPRGGHHNRHASGVGQLAGHPSSGWRGLPMGGGRNILSSDHCPPTGLSPTVVTATLPETGLVSLGILLLLATPLPFCRHQRLLLLLSRQQTQESLASGGASGASQAGRPRDLGFPLVPGGGKATLLSSRAPPTPPPGCCDLLGPQVWGGLGPLHPILPPPPSRLLFLGPWASGSPRQTPMEEPESRGRRPIFLEEAVD